MWLVLALTGFMVLVTVVIVLGTRSTKLYEQTQRGEIGAAASVGAGSRPGSD